MSLSRNQFKGKHVLVLAGGSSIANWLLDRQARVIVADKSLIRSLQAHARSIAMDGADYERRKHHIVLASSEISPDLIIASSDGDIREAHQRGIPVVSPKQLSGKTAVPERQRIVEQSRKLTVVDDSGAIGPERAVASLAQWAGPNCILIAGGKGRGNYQEWAQVIRQHIRPTNLIFISGSATNHMRKALGSWVRGVRTYDSVEKAWEVARKRARLFVSAVVLFSPAAQQ